MGYIPISLEIVYALSITMISVPLLFFLSWIFPRIISHDRIDSHVSAEYILGGSVPT